MIKAGRNCPVLSISHPGLDSLWLEYGFLAVIFFASLGFRYRARYHGRKLTRGDDCG
jgi:hypothetical protein